MDAAEGHAHLLSSPAQETARSGAKKKSCVAPEVTVAALPVFIARKNAGETRTLPPPHSWWDDEQTGAYAADLVQSLTTLPHLQG